MRFVSIIILLFVISSCEKDWNKPYEDLENIMCMHMVAIADSYIYGQVFPVSNILKNNSWELEPHQSITSISNGSFSVNGSKPINFTTHKQTSYFNYDYSFKAGDKVDVTVSQYYYKTINASAVIPDKPNVEISYIGEKVTGTDTLMQIKIKIADNGNKKNYYMLNASTFSDKLIQLDYNEQNELVIYAGYRDTTVWEYGNNPVFSSDDKLFYDEKVINTGNRFKFPDYFSHIFSDNMFNGKEYEFTIECKKIHSGNPNKSNKNDCIYSLLEEHHYVKICLTELSEDYYNYQKMWEYSDNSNNSTNYFSAVEGGMGVLGAVNRSKPVRFDFKK